MMARSKPASITAPQRGDVTAKAIVVPASLEITPGTPHGKESRQARSNNEVPDEDEEKQARLNSNISSP